MIEHLQMTESVILSGSSAHSRNDYVDIEVSTWREEDGMIKSTEADLAQRLTRVEDILAIQQLPIRDALAVDQRDVDECVGLLEADVPPSLLQHAASWAGVDTADVTSSRLTVRQPRIA
jgi:hypothetical protein